MIHTNQGIMPGNGGGLDPVLRQYMDEQRTQQIFSMLSQAGQALMSSNARGQSPIRALSAGLAQARSTGMDPIQMLQTQEMIDRIRARQETKRRDREQDSLYRDLLSGGSGFQPSSGVTFSQARPGNPDVTAGMTPAQRGVLSGLPRKEGFELLAKREFPAPIKYAAPATVLGPNGQPQLVRFPQTGTGPPVPVEGYRPYTKPGEGPAVVQTADAYRRASEQAGITVSQLEALQWARTSVSKSPSDIFTSLYTSLVRGFVDPEEAKSTATEMTQYIVSIRQGGLQSEPEPAVPESAGEPPLIERAKDFLSFTSDPAPGGASLNPVGTVEAATPTAVTTPPAYTGVISQGRVQTPPRRKPDRGGGKSIETMNKDQVVNLIYGGRELSQDEIDRLDARLKALGF